MRIYKGSVSELILLVLEKTIDGYVRFEDYIYNPGLYAYGSWGDRHLKKSELAQALKRLREKGLVETEKDTKGLIIKLTELGKDALGDISVPEKDWDGKWRVVIFDIPERKRLIRNLFRRRLRDWGFKNWQKSVWITRSNITEKLRKLVSKLNIEQWVAVIETDDPALKNIL
ncbi:hypothetical protein HYT18_02390 [Candidatus Microgenomates bacterium]|nr:hypothetical protein [Candidatus Microgenomates bacterium]